MVDNVKTTIGGLSNKSDFTNCGVMTERPDYTVIGDRLRRIREGFSELSQRQWAEKNNFNPTQYNNWEKGTRRISVDAAEALSNRYGLSLDFIYRGRVDGLSEKASKVL